LESYEQLEAQGNKRLKGEIMKLEKEQLIKLYTNLVRARKADELILKGPQAGR